MHCLKCSVPVLAAVLACSPSAHSQLPQAHPSRPLTTVAAVVERLSQKAPSGTAVRLRAQIAFVDPEWRLLFIRDTSGSSFVQLPPKTKMSPLRSGDVIQMTGRTSPGDVGPTILHPKIRVIARRPLAAPRALSLAAIQAGLANGQYVLTEGVIRPGPVVGNHTWLTLVDRNNATLIIIPGALSRSALALLGAHVLVRGISAVRRDDAERPIGHELFVQSVDDVRAQPSKWQGLFGSAVVSISAIRDSNVADRFATYHVGGRVLRKELDGFVITGSVEVRAAEAPAVARGSIVEVIGLPQLEHVAVSLDHAQFWVLDSVFSPFRTSQSLSEAQALRSGQDDEPLQMPGRVISDVRSGRDDGIFIADGRKQFELAVAAPRQVGLPYLAPGSIVEASDTLRRIRHSDGRPNTTQLLPNFPANVAAHTRSVDWRAITGVLIVMSIASVLFWNRQIDAGLQAAVAFLRLRLAREGHENRYRRQVERNLEAVFSWRSPGGISDPDRTVVDTLGCQAAEHVIAECSCSPAISRRQIHCPIDVLAGAVNEFRTSRTRRHTAGDDRESSIRSERDTAEIAVTGWKAAAHRSRPATDRLCTSGHVEAALQPQ